MFISTIQELSFHRENGVTLKWRTRFLLCVDQCSKDSILLMCIECIQALYPYGNSWVVGKALWHIKTKHHQDFHPDDAWFVFSNPVRQMPYINHFRGLLFYDHPSNCQSRFFYRLRASNLGLKLFFCYFLLTVIDNATEFHRCVLPNVEFKLSRLWWLSTMCLPFQKFWGKSPSPSDFLPEYTDFISVFSWIFRYW